MAHDTYSPSFGARNTRSKPSGTKKKPLERRPESRKKRGVPLQVTGVRQNFQNQSRAQTAPGQPEGEQDTPATDIPQRVLPEILAPAGGMQTALAALAAGADALYLGLKNFSARMQADNFSTTELARLTDLAHAKNRRIYIAMNTLIKPAEPPQVFRLIRRLALNVKPDALIVQDPALLDLARQAEFEGEMHLSTLANVTHPLALRAAHSLGFDRVIMPRELSLEELRRMDASCPDGLALEVFVHGALCYCVSGRCWWSSGMGGKSGLRGRCVQPCRRIYKQKGKEGRFFSCRDLSLDVLTRPLLALERIRSWKIEGRKKGPHSIYTLTQAYRLLRDGAEQPEARKEALALLETSLGRPGTRALFLGGSSDTVVGFSAREGQTGSGLLCGYITKNPDGRYEVRTRINLLPKDFLRVGYEDEDWHCTLALAAPTDAGTPLVLALPRSKHPKSGTPLFLIDRRPPRLNALLTAWGKELRQHVIKEKSQEDIGALYPTMPTPLRGQGGLKRLDVRLVSFLPHGKEGKSELGPGTVQGLWLSVKALHGLSKTLYSRISWWLPPLVWPDEEATWLRLVANARRAGARHFVCNAPWQAALFTRDGAERGLSLTAGPFCNIANAPALNILRDMGFHAAVISPELGQQDILSLPGQSPLPLGIVVSGFWPAGITRHKAEALTARECFQSPRGEEFWMRRYGQNIWLYPARPLDLSAHRPALERAGYRVFIHMGEQPPQKSSSTVRPSEYNWNVGLL